MVDQALVTDVMFPTAHGACFGVPILRVSAVSNARYIQQLDFAGRVASLEAVDPGHCAITPLEAPFETVALGDEPVHAARAPSGQILVGRVKVLKRPITAFFDAIDHDTTRLAFAEFLNDRVLMLRAARGAHGFISRHSNPQTARRWFLDAVVLGHVHRAVFAAASAVTDLDRLDHLVSLCRVEASGKALVVTLPSELEDELGLSRAEMGPGLDRARSMATTLGLRAMEVRVEPGGGKPRWQRAPEEAVASQPTVSVIFAGTSEIFEPLAQAVDRRKFNELDPAARRREPHLALVAAPTLDAGTITRLMEQVEVGESHTTLVVLPAFIMDEDMLTALVEDVLGAGEMLGWRNHQLFLALVPSAITSRQQQLERKVATMEGVRGVLSLGNAWTPLGPIDEGRDARMAAAIEGWLLAVRSGAFEAIRRDAPVLGHGMIVTAARPDEQSGEIDPIGAALGIANPLWPNTDQATLMVGRERPGRGVFRAVPRERLKRQSGSVQIIRLIDPQRTTAPAFALTLQDPHQSQGAAEFEAYIWDVLVGLKCRVTVAADDTGDLIATLPSGSSVTIDVKLNLRAERRIQRRAGTLLVAREIDKRLGDGSAFVVGFEQLVDLKRIVHELQRADRSGDTGRPFPRRNLGLAFSGARIDRAALVPPELAMRWLDEDPSLNRILRPLLASRDIARLPQGWWALDFSGQDTVDQARVGEQIHYLLSEHRREEPLVLPTIPSRLRSLDADGSYLVTPVSAKHRPFLRCRGAMAPTSSLIIIREDKPWMLALLSSRIHRIWADARSSRHGGQRYSVTAFETFPLPRELAWIGEEDISFARRLSDYSRELHLRRAQWQYPGIFDASDGIHPELLRAISRDQAALNLESLPQTLTSLYEMPPPWYIDIMERIERLVAQAYGLDANSPCEAVLDRLESLAIEADPWGKTVSLERPPKLFADDMPA